MIPHKFAFFWSWGTTMSYLRYLSLATCRHWHPDWKIELYQAKFDEDLSLGWNFGDFQNNSVFGKDYSPYVRDVLHIETKEYVPADKRVLEMPPPNISDIFSYEHLYSEGGWYADMDCIFTRDFEHISDQDYAFVGFGNLDDWIGMFGARAGSWVMQSFVKPALDGYDPNSYNSSGTYAIVQACSSNPEWLNKFAAGDDGEKNWRCPSEMFYPLRPVETDKLWKSEDWEHSRGLTWSVHLFGGNSDYAIKNKQITPEYLADPNHKEWVCRYVRSLGNKGLFLLP